MSLKVGNDNALLVKGDLHPAEFYKGDIKYAGFHDEVKSGTAVDFSQTYNDTAEVVVEGETVQISDWYAKDGLSSQVVTVQGKNLFSIANNGNITQNGVTCSIKNGIITLNGTTTSPSRFNLLKTLEYAISWESLIALGHRIAIVSGSYYNQKGYYISGSKSGIVNITTLKSDGTVYIQCPSDVSQSALATENMVYSGYIIITTGVTFSDYKFTIQLELGGVATAYEPFVPNSPSPEYPSVITTNLPADTYKVQGNDGWYEFTLTEELRGSDTAIDKIAFDRVGHVGKVERRIGSIVLNGSTILGTTTAIGNGIYRCAIDGVTSIATPNGRASHFSLLGSYSSQTLHFYVQIGQVWLFSTCIDSTALQNWLAINPVTVIYQLATPTNSTLTFTKNNASTATEVPMTFLTNTPQLDYPAQVYDVTGNLKSHNADSSKTSSGAIPPIRSVLTVRDEWRNRTGKKLKKISEWVVLDGGKNYGVHERSLANYIKFYYTEIPNAVATKGMLFDYASLGKTLPFDWDFITNYLWIKCLDVDTGFGSPYSPTPSERKSYFHGWRMCNADGTSPYYKSEGPYTPTTWAEVTISGIGNSKDTTGVLISEANVLVLWGNTVVGKKYGFLYNVVSKAGGASLNNSDTFTWAVLPSAIGNNKVSISATATGTFKMYRPAAVAGDSIKLKDIRIFELPAGSQIEADFTNLTADQLAAKYTFNGLCPKNWKHVTDGLGQTAVLPTATYDGYTPYKMIYQLATPVEEQFDSSQLETYYPTTFIETDCVEVIPTLTATAKVID